MRTLPFGANYLDIGEMPELVDAIADKTLFRFLTPRQSAADKFERLAEAKLGTTHALAVRSGTEALRLALIATNPRVGDQVFIPAVTFVAVAGAVLSCGLIPVLADVDERFNLDVEKLPPEAERVIVAHMDGMVGPVPARARFVVEDCCQCFGASHPDNRKAGAAGYAGIYSFNHQKILTAGEGGLLVTSDSERYRLMRRYHDHGARREHGQYPRWEAGDFYGENFVTSETVAAVQLQQLRRLDDIQTGLERGYRIMLDALQAEGSNNLPFEIVSRRSGDTKNTVRLLCESAASRNRLAERLTGAGLSYWSLDRYNLAAHPVLRDRRSIYADGFPWNLQAEPQDLSRFEPLRNRLACILCLPIPPELDADQQARFSECYINVLREA
jgi:dTDP-4-amino-4,6-dideoxygalactose transaminase